ncbi:MAG: hypothetical protein KGL35_27250 [Bradyrhizobium sp.]|nr:hypothetical protein [Bradyrhizobium sp.]
MTEAEVRKIVLAVLEERDQAELAAAVKEKAERMRQFMRDNQIRAEEGRHQFAVMLSLCEERKRRRGWRGLVNRLLAFVRKRGNPT